MYSPPLNPSSVNNEDLTANLALNVDLPWNDPDPVGLTLTPPGPAAASTLNLALQNPGWNLDISPLIGTPVNKGVYPNYDEDQWTFVLRPESGRAALAGLPISMAYPLPDPGYGGELENHADIDLTHATMGFQDAIQGIDLMVNPKNLQLSLAGL
jgi:hypothetical protein